MQRRKVERKHRGLLPKLPKKTNKGDQQEKDLVWTMKEGNSDSSAGKGVNSYKTYEFEMGGGLHVERERVKNNILGYKGVAGHKERGRDYIGAPLGHRSPLPHETKKEVEHGYRLGETENFFAGKHRTNRRVGKESINSD